MSQNNFATKISASPAPAKSAPPRLTFRSKALESLSSSDLLLQRLHVRSLKPWFALAALGVIVFAVLIWSIVGRIPVTVQGRGVLVLLPDSATRPKQLAKVISQGSGILKQLYVQRGDRVRQAQPLAQIDQSQLQLELKEARQRLNTLTAQNVSLSSIEQQQLQSGLSFNQMQIDSYLQQVAQNRQITKSNRQDTLAALQQQQQSLRTQLKNAQQLSQLRRDNYNTRRRLQQEGVISADAVMQTEQDYLDSVDKVSGLKAQLQQVNAQVASTQRDYLQAMQQVQQLQNQVRNLQSQRQQQILQNRSAADNRRNEINAARDQIAQLQLQLQEQGQVISDYEGQVLELFADVGDTIQVGMPLGVIQTRAGDAAPLKAVLYFQIGDGFRVRPGMRVEVTPATVTRERYGGLLAKVTQVVDYPIEPQEAAAAVDEPELAQALTQQGNLIEVQAQLQPDASTVSRYRWTSSRGPNQTLFSGTTVTAQVTVEQRAPITYVLPILREWTGL